MVYLKKFYAWCVQHWRWLIFGLVALIAYVTGRKSARNLWMQAELARKQYKREAAEIEKAHAAKSKKIKKVEKIHNRKIESVYVISGEAEVFLEDDNGVLQSKVYGPGSGWSVPLNKKHRVYAKTDFTILEAQSPHLNDIIRFQDDTNRQSGTLKSEHEGN